MTAVSNDLSYDEVFVYQLRSLARPGDALVAISSSGRLREHRPRRLLGKGQRHPGDRHDRLLRRALRRAGGRQPARRRATTTASIEDVHQSLMHILAQYIRQAHMDEESIAKRTF